jgi:hypothetical protein
VGKTGSRPRTRHVEGIEVILYDFEETGSRQGPLESTRCAMSSLTVWQGLIPLLDDIPRNGRLPGLSCSTLMMCFPVIIW